MIMIGIDPGVHTGVAIWDCDKQEFLDVTKSDFWSTWNLVLAIKKEHGRLVVYVEDPRGNKPVFNRGQKGRKNLKIAQNVGGNKKEAGLMIRGLKMIDIPVVPIVPKSSKWDAAMFKKISGYEGRTNQHGRDAGRLVVGRSAMPDNQYQKMISESKGGNIATHV